MGIRGLFTMIENDDRSYQIKDLVCIAKSQNEIEILVDFHAFQRDLVELISRKISNEYDNEYLLFPAGDYDIFKDAFTEFHNHFNDAGIKLVWIIDGPKGVDEVASKQKEETWIKRYDDDISQMSKVLSGCTIKSPPKNLNNLGPLLSFEIAIDGLKAARAEIIQLLQGGSDEFIAFEFHKRKAFAIITGDTDFLVFRDLQVIFPRLMNMRYGRNNLLLPFIDNENPGKIFKKPDNFLCPIVSQDSILKLLKLSNHGQLVALSIIKGNDNTEEYAQNLQYSLKISKSSYKNAHVTQVAGFIARHSVTQENILSLPGMNKFLVTYPQLTDTIKFCYDFYTLKHFEEHFKNSRIIFDQSVADDSLTSFIREKLSKSKISKKIYSIHCGIFHNSVFAEKPTEKCPSNTAIMSEIRSRLYPYLLDNKLDEVIDWRPRGYPHKVAIPVKHATFKTNEIEAKPKLESESSDAVIYGIDIFEEIWSHLEQEPLKYIKTFGLERGFICYLLRYFYMINKEKNLNISIEEFKALFITVFYKYALSEKIPLKTKLRRDTFLGMKICPTEKCLIIYAWFMNIYFTGKYLCGGAFNLTDDFPPPGNVMSGSVLYAFYENIGDGNNRTSHLDSSLVLSIEELRKEILEAFSAEYDSITK